MTNFHKARSFYNHDVAKKAAASILKQPVDDITCKPLAGGSDESSVLKCTYQSTSCIVKFFSTGEFGKNEIAWTQHASDLDIGPKLYYADPAGDYMVVNFVRGSSLIPATANKPAIIKSIAKILSRLHRSSAPFGQVSDTFARIYTKYKKLHCTGKLKDILENGMHHVINIERQLRNLSVSPVPCHNDLNPGNVFVINNQVTLIDWGDAALGDPYYDIAAFFVLNVIEAENEKLFFNQYDAKLLEPQCQVYMKMCKQVVYFEFALNLLLGVQASKSELLHLQNTLTVNHLSYYLTLLAKKEVKIDNTFLYTMAVASLNEMSEIDQLL